MNTEERAQSLMDSYYGGEGQFRPALKALIIQALKEQDRDTRHACAEAVSAIPPAPGTVHYIDRDAAHAACMNVQAV